MNHKKIKEIIKFSIYNGIHNKWFIIFNILSLLAIVLFVNWSSIVDLFNIDNSSSKFEIAILDNSNLVYDRFFEDLSGDERFEISRIQRNDYTSENIPNDFMIIEVSGDKEETFIVSIISKEGIDAKIYNSVKEELYKIRNTFLSSIYNIDNESIEVIQRDLKIERIMLSVEADNSAAKEMIKLFSAAFSYMIMVFIFSKLANEIASEKQSKAIEYILTTVSEKEYLFAKIFSSIALLILQGLFLMAYYYISALLFNITKTVDIDFSISASLISKGINSDIVYYIFMLIVYNILTIILLCIIQATLASKTSSTTEAGNSVSLLLIVIMMAYISTIYFLRPYEKVSIFLYIISCIPILSAYFVPGMIAIGQATVLQIGISLILLCITIPLAFHYCAGIFKNGILDYSKFKRKKDENVSAEERKEAFLSNREMKRFSFVIGMAIIIYVGTQVVFSLLGSLVLSALFSHILNDVEITMLLQILLQMTSIGFSISFVKVYIDKEHDNKETEKKQLFSKKNFKIVLIALFLVFILQVFLSVVLYPLLGLDYDTTDLFKVDANSRILSKIFLIIAIAIVPAFFEEVFFRNIIVDYSRKYGKIFAFLFSALLFGLLHMNLSQGLFAFIMGLIFAGIYIYTGDIRLTIIIHLLNNGFAAFVLILPPIGTIVLTAFMLIVVIIGFVLFVKMVSKKHIRKEALRIASIKIDLHKSWDKYKIFFTDYAFDISLILVFLMSIMTEKILR